MFRLYGQMSFQINDEFLSDVKTLTNVSYSLCSFSMCFRPTNFATSAHAFMTADCVRLSVNINKSAEVTPIQYV